MFWRRKKKNNQDAADTPADPPDAAEPDVTPEPEIATETLAEAEPEPEPTASAAVEPEAPAPPADDDANVPKEAADPDRTAAEPERKRGWLSRLRAGLSRSTSKVGGGIGSIFTKRKLDDEALEELEELLISADLGVSTAGKLTAQLGKRRFGKEVDPESVRDALAEDITEILDPVARPLDVDPARQPHVVLVVGVNGSGKTTTIGKLAKHWTDAGHKVHLAAGDTFRAAAVEQLQIWGQRSGCPVTVKDTGADAAGLAYDALQAARKEGADVLLVDTAGRLHNKSNLMSELQKVVRVIQKLDPSAPHDTLLVLDATVGQNAVQQVQTFRELVNVSGLAVTKLDGSARGGILVALAEKFGLPVHVIGVGETADDMRPFKARNFARALVGLDPES